MLKYVNWWLDNSNEKLLGNALIFHLMMIIVFIFLFVLEREISLFYLALLWFGGFIMVGSALKLKSIRKKSDNQETRD